MTVGSDYYTKEGAEDLIRVLKLYWEHEAGPGVVTFRIEPMDSGRGPHSKTVFCVRSNLIAGRPPQR